MTRAIADKILIVYNIGDVYVECLIHDGSTYDFKVCGEIHLLPGMLLHARKNIVRSKTLGVIDKNDITNALLQLTTVHPKFVELLRQFGHIE